MSQLNATIQSCGRLVEPVNGVLPANKKVLFVTSPNLSTISNSFAALSDTLYIIFQNTNFSTNAFFINWAPANTPPAPDAQTTRISFGGSCSDQVTYLRSRLVTQFGFPGAEDGATVNFDFAGNATYINNGCVAPVTALSAAWNAPQQVCSSSGVIQLNPLVTGTPGGVWSGVGVVGNTFNPALVTGSASITYTVSLGACSLNEVKVIQVIPQSTATWAPPSQVCSSSPPLDLSTFVTGTPGGTFSGTGVSGNLFNPALVNGSSQITYSIGTGACLSTEVKSIAVISVPQPVVVGEDSICAGDPTIGFQVTNAGSNTVNWYSNAALTTLVNTGATFGPSAQSAVYYVVFNQNNCNSTPTLATLTVTDTPSKPTGDTLVSYCAGGQLPLLTLNSTNSLIWYSDSLLQTQVFVGPSFQPTNPAVANYWVIAKNGNCVSDAIKVTLVAEQPITASITPDGPTTLCSAGSVQLSSSSLINNSWSTTETTPTIVVSQPGVYTLTINGGCNTAEDSIEIFLEEISVELSAPQTSGEAPFSFVANGTSTNADSCAWFLNNEAFNYTAGQEYVFVNAGIYKLLYSCANDAGCQAKDSVEITVISNKVELIVPDVFTPNGDGVNDLFSFKISGIKQINGTIYSRWGQKVYSWEGLQPDWDGTIQGKKATEGVYFYVISGIKTNDEAIDEKGSVTLIRN